MTDATLAGLLAFDVVGLTVKSLAVVGGAVLGGLGVGGLAGLLVRLASTRKMPARLRWLLRSLGGVAAGWIVALFLFGGGGGFGIGGTGGWGLGGSDDGSGNRATEDATQQDLPATKATGNPLSSPSTELRIEVLGDEPLRKLQPTGTIDFSHCYRIDGEVPPTLRTLEEMKDLITHRLTQKPPLKRIEILLYRDSPGRKVKRAADIEGLLDDLVAAQKNPTFAYGVNDKLPTKAPVR